MLPVSDGWGPLPSEVGITPPFDILTDELGNVLTDEDGVPLIEMLPSFTSDYAFLPETTLTAFHVKNSSGTSRYFAFSASKIYEFNKTDYGWDDVTRTTGGTYSAADRWSVTLFGDRLYAQNGTDAEQWIDIDSGTNFADNATAPVARYIATVGDFLVRGAIDGTPNQIQWSAINDPESNVIGVNGCDVQNFAEGQEVTGIVSMSFGAVIILREAIYAMNFALASEYVFTFQQVSGKKGSASPWSVVPINQDDFIVYCADGFARGAGLQPIGALKVDDWLVDNSTQSSRAAMVGTADPARKIVWFQFTDDSAAKRWLGYNWQLDRWFTSDMTADVLFRSATLQVTIDALDNYYSTIDSISVPYDSAVFDGGTPQCAVITSSGTLGFISGVPMAASLTTNQIALNGTRRAFVNGGRLVSDATAASVTMSVADYMGQTMTDKSAVSQSSRTKFISLRGDGRVHKFALSISAGASWSILSGIDVELKNGGRS